MRARRAASNSDTNASFRTESQSFLWSAMPNCSGRISCSLVKGRPVLSGRIAVDGEVEHRQIAFAVLDLKSDTNGPDLFRPKGTLLANETAFVPCDARRSVVDLGFGGHGYNQSFQSGAPSRHPADLQTETLGRIDGVARPCGLNAA